MLQIKATFCYYLFCPKKTQSSSSFFFTKSSLLPPTAYSMALWLITVNSLMHHNLSVDSDRQQSYIAQQLSLLQQYRHEQKP